MDRVIGVLALQGAYQKHIDMLHALNIPARRVRQPNELNQCHALILPGGESTTISLLIQEYNLYEAIRSFAEHHPVMGVCAGMIMMASEVEDARITPLRLMPFSVIRNHYGRQLHSFTADIKLNFSDSSDLLHAHFIRAPGIAKLSADIEVLARYNKETVMISKGKHIALSFHPELTDDTRIHEYWLSNFGQDTPVEQNGH
jgi:pyridoxal 5'-phosphate synthase pdxT subunit